MQAALELPDLTVEEELDEILAGVDLSVSPTTAGIASGRCRMVTRAPANDDGLDIADAS